MPAMMRNMRRMKQQMTRNEVFRGNGQADDEGFGAEICRCDELQNEAVGQKEDSLLSRFPSGFITS